MSLSTKIKNYLLGILLTFFSIIYLITMAICSLISWPFKVIFKKIKFFRKKSKICREVDCVNGLVSSSQEP